MLMKVPFLFKKELKLLYSFQIPKVEDFIINNLKAHRRAQQPPYTKLVQIVIISISKTKALKLLLEDRRSPF